MDSKKSELRKRLKQRRLELTNAEHTLMSRAICEGLTEVTDWSKVKAVHFFEPIRELLEVDLNNFISDLQDTYADMSFFTTKEIEGQWETVALQPGEVPDSFDGFDVIIVPMLGFDQSLNRIGYGGGFYDKFLAEQPDALKVGVCFDEGIIDQLPAEPPDIPMDLIVTEDRIYKR
jgi:5-formyltetrahydrofolate cyclo-ligase